MGFLSTALTLVAAMHRVQYNEFIETMLPTQRMWVVRSLSPMGRICTVKDIADAVHHLLPLFECRGHPFKRDDWTGTFAFVLATELKAC